MAAISGKVARIRITSASATNSTNEASDLSTDGVTLSINDTGKRHWDRTSTAPAVFISGDTGTDVSSEIESINYVQGTITFTTPHSTSTTITMDVDFLTGSFLVGGRGFDVNVDNNVQEITSFSTSATDVVWRTYLAGLNSATISIDQLYQSDSTAQVFWDALNAPSSNLIVELVPDGALDRYEAFCHVAGFSPSVPIDGVVDQGVDLQVDGVLYYTTN